MDAVRGLADVITLPVPGPGFIGDGHTAIHVMEGREFARTDPFIMLPDDRIDLPPGTRAGGPHPHAGFEIVTFAVEGAARDRDEGLLRAGDVLWMTAGSGVVHERQNVPIVSHGPFVGETHADLVRVSRAYAEGRMPRVSELGR